MKRTALFSAALMLATTGGYAMAQDKPGNAAGDWKGVLDAGAVKIRLALHLGAQSTFDSPDQGAMSLPADMTIAENGTVTVQLRGAGTFQGTLSGDGDQLSGRYMQGGSGIPIVFQRGTFVEVVRPQTPRPPFPYKVEEVGYENLAEPDVHLAGTLTTPVTGAPFPAVLLITGSGAQDRDETILEHKPFAVLADALTRRGIAVLRVDDRGIGGSSRGSPGATTASFATDVEAGLAWLRNRPDIDPKRIGLIGHSEGGVIAPLVASRDPGVAFIVMWAGTGVPGREIIIDQVRALAAATGISPSEAQSRGELQARLLDALLDTSDLDSARAAMNAVMAGLDAPPISDGSIATMNSPWYRHFLTHDPAPALRTLRIPVLALLGGKDMQVSPALNEQPIRAALADDPQAQIEVLPGLNHLFQRAVTGQPDEYRSIEETIDPAALTRMVDWVVQVSGAGKPAP